MKTFTFHEKKLKRILIGLAVHPEDTELQKAKKTCSKRVGDDLANMLSKRVKEVHGVV
ncbi:hypothetical protein [Vibrio phage RYC]|nr:hypothetical protein [Vibrio phage RYC]